MESVMKQSVSLELCVTSILAHLWQHNIVHVLTNGMSRFVIQHEHEHAFYSIRGAADSTTETNTGRSGYRLNPSGQRTC